jgi:CheY-like chemotaxis protein
MLYRIVPELLKMTASPLILVVDDVADMRELLRELLRLEGYRTETAGDVSDALALLEGIVPDAILTDLMMPGRTAADFVRALRGRGVRLPVIVITALDQADARVVLADAVGSVAGIVRKPFVPEALLETLRGVLAARAASSEQALAATPLLPAGPGSETPDGP